MGDLKNPTAIWVKGILFFILGVMAVAILLLRHPEIQTAIVLAIAIWSFCRCYYFAFYVIEKYVDSEYRFAGLWHFVQYVVKKRK